MGTHLWLKSFSGLPQLINHRLVGVLCLGSSLNRQPNLAATQNGCFAFPSGLGGSKIDPRALSPRFSRGTLQLSM